MKTVIHVTSASVFVVFKFNQLVIPTPTLFSIKNKRALRRFYERELDNIRYVEVVTKGENHNKFLK